MRIDVFLRNSGRIPRRTQAKRACDEGLVEVDGQPAKPGTEVEVGQEITVRLGMTVRRYRILQLPQRPAPKKKRDCYTQLLNSERIEPDLDW